MKLFVKKNVKLSRIAIKKMGRLCQNILKIFSPTSKIQKENEMFITDQEMKEMQSRNEARAKAMRESMGARHLLHPSNAPKKVEHKFVLSAQ